MVEAHTYRTTRYRLLPETAERHAKLMQVAGACIFVWNHFLARNQRDYRWHEQAPWLVDAPWTSWQDTFKEFTQLRRNISWLRELPSNPVRHTLKHQSLAWAKYFKSSEKSGRPKFKSKYREPSVTFPDKNTFKIRDSRHWTWRVRS